MLLIFDWDGTLSDSTGKIVGCMQQAIDDCGLPPRSDAAIRHIIGLGLGEAIADLYPEQTATAHLALRERYVQHFLAADETPSPFYPGVMAALTRWIDDGHLVTIATGKSRRGLDRVLANLGLQDFFHATRCADETRSKPHPQMLLELLAQFAVTPADALMIGDTHYDLEMARNAGVPSVAVRYGAHDEALLLPSQPLAIIDHIDELARFIPESISAINQTA